MAGIEALLWKVGLGEAMQVREVEERMREAGRARIEAAIGRRIGAGRSQGARSSYNLILSSSSV